MLSLAMITAIVRIDEKKITMVAVIFIGTIMQRFKGSLS